MNLDDESLLSAYLDGELTPREQERVEAALESDPSVADRLRELSRVREVVGGLPHPQVPFDLSRTIVARLSAPAARRPVVDRLRAWQSSYLDVALSTAAVLLAAGVVGALAVLRDLHPPDAVPRPRAVAAPSPAPPAPLVAVERQPEPVAPPSRVEITSHAVPREAVPSLTPEDEAQFRAMIDSPNLKRVFFVVDAVGGRADERVGEIVESMPRTDSMYACMTIVSNVGVDPKHPGGAKVFAVAVTDPELRQVGERLRETFQNAVEESEPDPAVVTQLADIGRVSLHPGKVVVELETPAKAAERIRALKGHPEATSEESPPEPAPGPTREQLASAPAEAVARRQRAQGSPAAPAAAPQADPKPALAANERPERDKTAIILIWVASR